MNILKLLFLTLVLFRTPLQAQQWSFLGQGNQSLNANDVILALTKDANGNIYAAGMFSANDSGYNSVAKWDGMKWSYLGGWNELKANDSIVTLTTDLKGNVYAAGKFTDDSGYYYIAKWDGIKWSILGNLNANKRINVIRSDDLGNIYAAGEFTNDSGYSYVAIWNDNTWRELGVNIENSKGFICDILIKNSNEIYMSNDKINKWDGKVWTEIGDFYNYVRALAIDNQGGLYASGDFVNNNNKKYVAKYDGKKWKEIGNGNNTLNTFGGLDCLKAIDSNHVYAAGAFVYDSTGNSYVAHWNGTSWSKLGSLSNLSSSPFDFVWSMILDNSGGILIAGDLVDGFGRKAVARYGFPLGIDNDLALSTFAVYPNPTSGLFNVQIPTQTQNELSIYNMLGEKIYTQTLKITDSNVSINLSAFCKGIYIIKLGSQSKKVIIE
jgi:hypothetical protein